MKRAAHTKESLGTQVQQAVKPASSRHALLVCVALVFATLGLYLQATNYPFGWMDDPTYVYLNPYVRHGLTLKGIEWAFTALRASNWHPLTWMSHMVDVQLYGLNPSGHHLTNLLLHIANSILLFLVLRRMTRSTWRSGFVAGLFALHPLHVESVAWIAERKDVLSTLFWMLTLWAYAAYAGRKTVARYLLVVLSLSLGLMAKPMLVSLPLVLLALDYWPLDRWRDAGRRPFLALLIEKLPLLAICGAASVMTLLAQRQGGAVRSFETYPLGVRFANALVAYVRYIEKMVWPSRLSFMYPHPIDTLPVWQVIASALVLIGFTYAASRLRRSHPYLSFGWAWFVITLIPVIGLVQVGQQAMADRYTYIPLIGLFVAIAWGIPDVLTKRLRLAPKYLAIPAVAVLVALWLCAYPQVQCWRSQQAMIERSMQSTNGDYTVRCWMADFLLKHGQAQQAEALLSSATVNKPGYAEACNALSCILNAMGRPREAEAKLREALRIRPRMAEAHNNLGTLLASRGDLKGALKEFLAAIRIESFYTQAEFNAGCVLYSMGDRDAALTHFRRAILSDPDFIDARCRASALLLQMGKTHEAMANLTAALYTEPESADALFLYGSALQQTGDLDGAIAHYSMAIKQRQDWGMAHATLAKALLEKGDYSAARQESVLAGKFHYPLPASFARELAGK